MDETTPTAPGPREVDVSDRMTEHEALMWNVEKDPWLNPNGAALWLFDRPVDLDRFRRKMRAAVASMPRLYQRVVPGLGRISTPAWVADREFDFDHHFRVLHLPSPGTRRQLFDLAAQLYCEPLDRTRPLWRTVVIEGLESGQGAMFSLIHHSIADGIGQLRMAEMFQEVERDAPWADDVDLDAIIADAAANHDEKEAGGDLATSLRSTLTHSASHLLRRQAGMVRRLAGEFALWPADPRRATDLVADVAATVKSSVGPLLGAGREIEGGAPLWSQRSRHRHLEHVSVPLDQLKAAAKAHDATVNDAFMTCLADAAVRYHADRGEKFEALNMSFVLSTRFDNRAGGNAFTPVGVQLPATPMTLAERLAEVRFRVAAAKEEATRGGGLTAISGVVNLLPTSVVTRTARAQAAKIDLATSNLRGAPIPLYVSGALVEHSVTMGPLAGTPCNATALSYRNSFDIGLFIDPVAIDEPEAFQACVAAAFDELLAGVAG